MACGPEVIDNRFWRLLKCWLFLKSNKNCGFDGFDKSLREPLILDFFKLIEREVERKLNHVIILRNCSQCSRRVQPDSCLQRITLASDSLELVLVLPYDRLPVLVIARLWRRMCRVWSRAIGNISDLVPQTDVLECKGAVSCMHSIQLFVCSEEVSFQLSDRLQSGE